MSGRWVGGRWMRGGETQGEKEDEGKGMVSSTCFRALRSFPRF